MTQQSRAFDEFIDKLVNGEKPGLAEFARPALRDVAKVETQVRYPCNRSVWPPEVWAEMEAIRKGEAE